MINTAKLIINVLMTDLVVIYEIRTSIKAGASLG